MLDRFLMPHTDTSMFIRSNIRRGGFVMNPQEDFSADYYGYFQGHDLLGVMALCWQGSILCQVPELQHIPLLFKTIQQLAPDFKILFILGDTDQVQVIFSLLEQTHPHMRESISKDSQQRIYTLDLDQLIMPESLRNGSVACRSALPTDLSTLVPWRMAYNKEVANPTTDESQTTQDTTLFIASQTAFVLESQGELVARSDFNATLPDTVQIGGVWVPPAYRNRGYARAVIAGSLLEGKRRGVKHAILFTENPAAVRCYESIGFKEKSIYHILIFDKKICLVEKSNQQFSF